MNSPVYLIDRRGYHSDASNWTPHGPSLESDMPLSRQYLLLPSIALAAAYKPDFRTVPDRVTWPFLDRNDYI